MDDFKPAEVESTLTFVPPKPWGVAEIQAAAIEHFGLPRGTLQTASREHSLLEKREIAMYYATLIKGPRSQVASSFQCNATTISAAKKKVKALLEADPTTLEPEAQAQRSDAISFGQKLRHFAQDR